MVAPSDEKTGGTTEELLEAARRGSHEALGRLLESWRHYLLLVAREELPADLRGKVGASDLVQQTFLEAQQDFGRFRGGTEDEFLGWLRRILRNNVANLTRQYSGTGKRQVGREVPLADVPSGELGGGRAGGEPSPSAQALGREQDEALERALARLPEHYRQVIRWRNYERCSFEEVGRRLGRSAEAARKLWGRALDELQKHLGPTDAPPPGG